MRALNSLAAKMSEKWEILHFPLLREKTSFIRQQRHDKVRAPGERLVLRRRLGWGGAHVALIRNSQGVTTVGGGKHRSPVLIQPLPLRRRHRADTRKRGGTTCRLCSVCCSDRNPTWCLPLKPLSTHPADEPQLWKYPLHHFLFPARRSVALSK